MKKINLNEEKISAKLLYLFDSEFYYKRNIYMESESNDKGVFLSTIKKIFSFIGSILKRFAFVAFLAVLIISAVITGDQWSFIGSVILGIILGTGAVEATKHLKSRNIEEVMSEINSLLKENDHKEIDFISTKGICYKNSELIYLSEAIKDCLDKDEENNFDNKKLKKIIKNLKDREEIEEKLTDSLNVEESNAIGYLESHGYKKISVEDFITLDKANKKTLLSKFFDDLEQKYAYKEYNKEKLEKIQNLKSNLSLNKTFANVVSKKNAFGLKTIMNYLNSKAKNVQNMLSDLLMLIISIFNPKTYAESNLTVKKEIRKIKFFLENYLKNDKNVFYEEKKPEFYNENFNLPFSKIGNPGNVIKITYRVKNHKISINSITNQVSIYGPNSASLWKEIFPDKSIEGESYRWQKGEWSIIRKYIENSNTVNEINNSENIDNKKNTNLKDSVDDIDNSQKNDDKLNNDNTEEKDNKTEDNEIENDKDKTLENSKEEEKEQIDNKEEVGNKEDDKVDAATVKSKTSYLLLMKKGIESTPVRYLIIGIIIALPFLFGKIKLATSAATTSLGPIASNITKLTTSIVEWLGWRTIFVSSAAGLGYIGIKSYLEKMNKKMLTDGMENAQKNSSKLESVITPALNEIQVAAEKGEKKKSIFDKAKNFMGIGKKETISDNYQYKNKKEILYNENYIMEEYFKIEKKLKKQVF
jgi:hypothetical protein